MLSIRLIDHYLVRVDHVLFHLMRKHSLKRCALVGFRDLIVGAWDHTSVGADAGLGYGPPNTSVDAYECVV